MKLGEWIESVGPKEVAKRLNVDVSTVSHWKRGHSFPRARTIKKIFELSQGRVNYREMVNHFCNAQVNK